MTPNISRRAVHSNNRSLAQHCTGGHEAPKLSSELEDPEFEGIEPRWAWAVDLDSTADLLPHLRPLTKSAPGLAIEGLGALGVLPGMVLGQRAGTDLAQNAGG